VGKYKCISSLEDNIKTDTKKYYRRAWRGWFRNMYQYLTAVTEDYHKKR
jgi:hypothetical protein